DLIARLLGDPGQTAWVEEPGYWGIGRVLAINGLKTQAVPVDAEGMNPALAARGAAPRFAFVTPSHQYPLGAIMSMGRRLALIELSIKAGTWIVEDDYDSEFRFSGHPVAALQGLALRAHVIYIGTFSKTLYPGMRTAYMVLPADLAKAFRTAHSELYRGGHVIAQAALAEYIDRGDYAAHIRKMRLVYASRRAFLIRLIEQWLGADWVHEFDTNAGLHVVLALPDGVDDVAIAQAAQERGVLTRALSRYYAGFARRGLLLGFACVPEADMLEPFKVLVGCIRQALPVKAARRRKAAA
ncbi:MAG: hypothetical protein JWP52_2256, partial [Rhizobacter sp.]|nr:hypothetical protein [Rhizobacter sp.]